MALTIEDGSVVSGADSYVSRADYIAYALSVGVVVADTDAADIELVKAAGFIGSYEPSLKGRLTDRAQPLSYPRYDLVLEGFSWGSDEIPRQVITCQMAFALDVNEGIDLYNPPVNENRATSKEKVDGAVEVEYFGSGANTKVNRTSSAQALLNTLLYRSGLSIVLERA